jgi:hypothetical protein
MQPKSLAAVAAILMAGVACGGSGGGGGGGTGPSGAAEIGLRVTVPAGNTDGVLLVRVSGDVIPTVLDRGFQLRAVGTGGSTVHIIARGALQGNVVVAALCLPRIEDVANYSVQVIQAAASQAGGYAKRSIASYSGRLDQATIVARSGC